MSSSDSLPAFVPTQKTQALWQLPSCPFPAKSFPNLSSTQMLKAIQAICDHDIRSPLSAIDLTAQVLDASQATKLKEHVQRILRQTNKAFLISDTLLYSCLVTLQSLKSCWSFFNPAQCLVQALSKTSSDIPLQLGEPLSCWGDPRLTTLALSQLIASLLASSVPISKIVLTASLAGINWQIHLRVQDNPRVQDNLPIPSSSICQVSVPKNSSSLQFMLANWLMQIQHGTLYHHKAKQIYYLWMPFSTPYNQLSASITKLRAWQNLPCAVLSNCPERAQSALICLKAAGFTQLLTEPQQKTSFIPIL